MGYTPEWEPMNTSASAIISRSARYSRTNWRSGGFFNFTRVLKGDDKQQTNRYSGPYFERCLLWKEQLVEGIVVAAVGYGRSNSS